MKSKVKKKRKRKVVKKRKRVKLNENCDDKRIGHKQFGDFEFLKEIEPPKKRQRVVKVPVSSSIAASFYHVNPPQNQLVEKKKKIKKKKVKITNVIVKKSLENVPLRIIHIFGTNYERILESIMQLVSKCCVRFKHGNSLFTVDFKDLCVYNYEMEMMDKHLMKGNKFTCSDDYKKIMAAINFDGTEFLNDVLVNFALGVLKDDDVHNDKEMLCQFTEEAKLHLRNSKTFLKDSKQTVKFRIPAIKTFNRTMEGFFNSKKNWIFPKQIVDAMRLLDLDKLPSGINEILKKTLTFVDKNEENYRRHNVHRIMYCIKVLCNILLKINQSGIGIKKLMFNYKTNPGAIPRIVDNLEVVPDSKIYHRFKKKLELTRMDLTKTKELDGNNNIMYRLNTRIEIVIFNRWTYLEYKDHAESIRAVTVWRDFKNYLRCNPIWFDNKQYYITSNIDKHNTYLRKQVTKNLKFIKLTRHGGRTFIFKENTDFNDEDGMYELELIEDDFDPTEMETTDLILDEYSDEMQIDKEVDEDEIEVEVDEREIVEEDIDEYERGKKKKIL